MKTLISVSVFHWKLSTLVSENLYILKTCFKKLRKLVLSGSEGKRHYSEFGV